jgi:hypothetical protein
MTHTEQLGVRAQVRAPRRTERDAVAGLVVRWKAAGTSFVVVDASGRHAAGLAAGRLDLTRAAVDTSWIEAVLHRAGYVLLDVCNVPRDARPLVVGRALTAVQRLRLHTGRPEWILLEDAQKLLQQPDLPPSALRLADGGYALAVRGGAKPARWSTGAGAFDIRVRQPGLELALIPPVAPAGHVVR